ncbi:MAG: hypothetical protein Aurels2KO_10920 [Aureliella sp.]
MSPAAGNYYSAPKRPAGRSIGNRLVWIMVASVAGTFAFITLSIVLFITMYNGDSAASATNKTASGNQTDSRRVRDRFRYSLPPKLPPPEISELALPAQANAQLLEVDLGAHNAIKAPGYQTQIRIYKPNSATQPESAICVLVPPAGTPLMHGMELGLGNDNDYHDEALPYVAKGMIVVQFSLDGWMPPPESFRNEIDMLSETGRQLVFFRAAHAGISNARIALDYALKHIPEIDPGRVFVAGHSSAGTLALQLSTAEPRLAGALAYAPVTDLQARLGEALTVPMIAQRLPGLSSYIATYNPSKLTPACPLFVFHALDDDNEPYAATQQYVSRLKQSTSVDVTLANTPRGGHYQSMIDQGIPGGIGWILSRK